MRSGIVLKYGIKSGGVMAYEFGKTLLLVNPAAQSGRAKVLGERALELLQAAGVDVELRHSEGSEHASALGAAAGKEGFATLVVLGGDGIIHHVAEGLMDVSADERPVLGIIPVGSGNDYAKTIHIPETVEGAVATLLAAAPQALDVVRVNDRHYLETLSFGLDAAIAIGTEERRKRTGETGLKLYFMTGLDEIVHRMYSYTYHARLEGVGGEEGHTEELSGSMKLFAVQNGRTYGGGFPITPDASATDGLLNICIASGKIGKPRTLVVFAKATKGKHVNSPFVEFHAARRVHISFEESEHGAPACQFDGEAYTAPEYDIEVLPRELKVLCGV